MWRRSEHVGGAGLAGVLPGLGSSMIRGPYAGRQLGQAVILPGIRTSGPLVLLDAGPEPGRWLRPWSRPPQPQRVTSPPWCSLQPRDRRSRGARGERSETPCCKWRSVSAPTAATFWSVALQRWIIEGHTGCRDGYEARCWALSVAGVAVFRCCTASQVHAGLCLLAPPLQHDVRWSERQTAKVWPHHLEECFRVRPVGVQSGFTRHLGNQPSGYMESSSHTTKWSSAEASEISSAMSRRLSSFGKGSFALCTSSPHPAT